MSLLDNGTKANPNTAYYSGGGGPTGPTLVASTLTVSTILGGGLGQTLNFPNGIDIPVGANIGLGGGNASNVGDIQFVNSNGQLLGVSTINNQPYPPPGAGANISTPLTSKWIAPVGGPQVISGTVPTTSNAWYNCSLGISDWSFSGAIAPGDHLAVLADTTVLGTLDLVQASTIKGQGQPYGMVMSGPVKAVSAGLQFLAYTNTAATASTFLSLDFAGWVSPLQ